MSEKVYISDTEIKENCKKLARELLSRDIKPDLLIGLNRGGLIPLGYLSYFMDNRNTRIIDIKTYEGFESKAQDSFALDVLEQLKSILGNKDKGTILIIDDLIDTGNTFKIISKSIELFNKNNNFRFFGGVLYMDSKKNNESNFPEFDNLFSAAEKPQGWLVFPWDEKVNNEK